jgi:membrane protein implicated in regulation of membrane protease activity
VRNPLRSEAEAFRFVLLAVAYFGAIAIASALGGRWAGVGVFVLLSVVAVLWVMQGRREQPPRAAPVRRGADDERRILVVANETVGGRVLREEIERRAAEYRERVLVVAPALNTPLRHWVSDEDEAREAAQRRLEESVSRLRQEGIDARGEVGDADPLQAIEDALRTFGPDEIIISTHPEGRSNWLERGIVSGARERFAVPITHVVVDLEAEREEVR